jgi:predicted nucleotide-binding protein
MAKKAPPPTPEGASDRQASSTRTRISQADVPTYPLEQALRIPRAIAENYAFKPSTPLDVAAALSMTPASGHFRNLCGASIAFGLTSGGYNAPEIKLDSLGMRIVRPLEEGDDIAAKREAILRPRVFREFFQKYDGAQLPRTEIAGNVLQTLGVPAERVEKVLEMLLESADAVGFLRQIKDKRYVDLKAASTNVHSAFEPAATTEEPDSNIDRARATADKVPDRGAGSSIDSPRSGSAVDHLRVEDEMRRRRVFVTHGKNKSFLDPIRKLLSFGELEPVVSVDRQSVSQPVPDKVMADMRSCGAAIIHVDAEQKLMDPDANEHLVLNPNVLIEIGAAMALYGRRFILLVREGVKLPSNLQGLYEVRYSSDSLDGDATIRLLEAIRDIKNHPAPLLYVAAPTVQQNGT